MLEGILYSKLNFKAAIRLDVSFTKKSLCGEIGKEESSVNNA